MNALLFSSLFTILLTTSALAKAGPPIPAPTLTITEATALASNYFYGSETRIVDGEQCKKEEYLLLSARYTNLWESDAMSGWGWQLQFVHPKQSDHAVGYGLTAGGELRFLGATE